MKFLIQPLPGRGAPEPSAGFSGKNSSAEGPDDANTRRAHAVLIKLRL
jgi:hypothetical protein